MVRRFANSINVTRNIFQLPKGAVTPALNSFLEIKPVEMAKLPVVMKQVFQCSLSLRSSSCTLFNSIHKLNDN